MTSERFPVFVIFIVRLAVCPKARLPKSMVVGSTAIKGASKEYKPLEDPVKIFVLLVSLTITFETTNGYKPGSCLALQVNVRIVPMFPVKFFPLEEKAIILSTLFAISDALT